MLWACACGDGGDGGAGAAGSGGPPMQLGVAFSVSLSPGQSRDYGFGPAPRGAYFTQLTGLPPGGEVFIFMFDGEGKNTNCTLGDYEPGPCNLEIAADAPGLEVTFENVGDDAIKFTANVNRR